MAMNTNNANENVPMNEVIKQERISKIEARIERNDRNTIKSVLEWVRNDKKTTASTIISLKQ